MNLIFKWQKIAFILALAFAFTGALSAQVDTGTVTGVVTDGTGAAIPGATVTLKSTATGAVRSAPTNGKGEYEVNSIALGPYNVAKGFGDFTTSVEVTVGGHVAIDAKLGPQATKETVDVTTGGGEVAVNTTDSEVGQTISTKQLEDLPSLTRNPYDFVELSGSIAGDPNGSTANGVGVSISGQRAASTEILLDGVENVDLFGASTGQTVPLDAVKEFSIITSGFSAEYGRATGGVINLVSKAGDNTYHGAVYEYNRVSALTSNTYNEDAENYFARQSCDTTPVSSCNMPHDHFTANRFGYAIGGRVWPKLHDKLFFFSSTEWNRIRSAGAVPIAVPTPSFIASSAANNQAFLAQYGVLGS
jgi:hypothetical protein